MPRKFIPVIVGFLIGFLGVGLALNFGNGNGIHTHGEHAVYIEDEACVVNVSMDNEDVIGDLVWCWRKYDELQAERFERAETE